jgi:hypothetical protein
MQQPSGEERAQQHGSAGSIAPEVLAQRVDVDPLLLWRLLGQARQGPLGPRAKRLGFEPEVLAVSDETGGFGAGLPQVDLLFGSTQDFGNTRHRLGPGRCA